MKNCEKYMIVYFYIISFLIKRYKIFCLNKTKAVWDINEILYSGEGALDAFMNGTGFIF